MQVLANTGEAVGDDREGAVLERVLNVEEDVYI
jgi:hypothetical protein